MADLKAERVASFISRLTPSEKRYFRKQHEGRDSQPVYLEIFDYLDAFPLVGNDEFDRHFKGWDFMRNPASTFNYLDGLLCASLEQYHRNKVPSISLVSELQAAKALWIRGFNKPALKRLKSIEKRAEGASEWAILSDCLQWKAKAVAKDASSADMLKELIEISKKRGQVIRQQEIALKWETKHVELVLSIFNQGAATVMQSIGSWKQWVELNADETATNFDARYFELWILGRISKLEGKAKDTHALRRKLLEHVDANSGWPVSNPTPYITILSNLAASAIELGDNETFEFVFAKLKRLETIDPNQPKLAKLLGSFLYLSLLNKEHRLDECLAFLPQAIRDYKAGSHLLVKMNQAVILYYFVFINLVGRNYREVHRWLMQIEQEIKPLHHVDVVCASMLFRLIAYYEAGNEHQLNKIAQEALDFLKEHAPEKRLENELALFFHSKVEPNPTQKEDDRLALDEILKSTAMNGVNSFHQKHLVAWLRSKVRGISLKEILVGSEDE